MPASERQITRADITPTPQFAIERKQRRAALLPVKKLRRMDLGPYCTVYFENFDTLLFQIQEMLLVEKGGEEQIADELAAYNPLVPDGAELVATVMFEIDDEVRRDAFLAKLGGVEDRFFLQIGDERVPATPEGDVERTRADGKTSSVHFLHFKLAPHQVPRFRDASANVMVGCSHPMYSHLAVMAPATHAELVKDLAG